MTSPASDWRGFNLIDLFSTSVRWKEFWSLDDAGMVPEQDFEMVRDLGFNFVRLPVSYLFLGKGLYGRVPDPDRLKLVDRVIEFGQKYGVHVSLNMHRAPGYCVLAPSQFDFAERDNLFTDQEPLQAYVAWWHTFAERYRDIPQADLSFDLLNEPMNLNDDEFNRTFLPAIDAIHSVNPDRYIHVEGSFRAHGSFDANGAVNSVEMVPPSAAAVNLPNVISSMHLYHPIPVTRYNCPWGSPSDLEPPTWPFKPTLRADSAPRDLTGDESKLWDKQTIRDLIAPYIELAQAGHPVHVGEMGAWPGIAHDVYIDYCRDVVDLLSEHGIGYSLWAFRGPFGVLDNGFSDAKYETYRGLQLDRKLVDVLKND
jgi:endoglucanase